MSDKFDCPVCYQRGVSFLRKLCLGPAAGTDCKSCGRRISVSWLAMVPTLPMAGLMAAGYITKEPLVYAGLGVVVVLGVLFHLYLVPMVTK